MSDDTEKGRIDKVRPFSPHVGTTAELSALVAQYRRADAFVIDVETVGTHRVDPLRNEVLWVGLAMPGRVDVIPMGHPNGELLEYRLPLLPSGQQRIAEGKTLRKNDYSHAESRRESLFSAPPPQLSPAEVFEALEPLFFGSNRTVIGHNVKFDLRSIAKYYGGNIPTAPVYDTLVAEFLINDLLQHFLSLDKCVKRRFGYEMDKTVGKEVEKHSFQDAARYLYMDCFYTWMLYENTRERLDKIKLLHLMSLEMDLAKVIMHMEHAGTLIDTDSLSALKDELDTGILNATAAAYRSAGHTFSVTSNADIQKVLFTEQKLTPKIFTEKKKEPSTADAALQHHAKNPVVKALLEIRELKKLQSTYVVPYLGGEVERTVAGKTRIEVKDSLLVNGRLHTSYKQHGARTGRLSCVSGDTLLITSRGTFRFDEYLPVEGDLVRTHTGRWMPVLRKIYKGVEPMYEVRSSDGGKLTCTAEHRLLTPTGWKKVGDLRVGNEVWHVSEQEVREQLRESAQGGRGVQGRRQADTAGFSGSAGYNISQRAAHSDGGTFSGGVRGGEVVAVLTVESQREEPYVGQEWFPAPQLHRGRGRWAWVQDAEGGRQILPDSPCGHGRSDWDSSEPTSCGSSCASHRRGQAQQLAGQSRSGDGSSTWHVARHSRIEEITSVGTMGVWDIEVAGDHSYAAGGFLNHNSASPNLQNIPNPERSEYGRRIRDAFIADPGHVLVQADWSQVEPRIIASLSKDKTLVDAFLSGDDPYTAISDPLGFPRSAGKLLILAMSYGVGPDNIAEKLKLSLKDAKKLLADFEKQHPDMLRHKASVVRRAAARSPLPYSITVLGRRRYLPELDSSEYGERMSGERKAYNHLIQGSASELMKVALIRLHKKLHTPGIGRLLLTVHDEVVVSAKQADSEEVASIVKSTMESVKLPGITVPLVADVKVVTKWGDAK